jgi:hypothetical protein
MADGGIGVVFRLELFFPCASLKLRSFPKMARTAHTACATSFVRTAPAIAAAVDDSLKPVVTQT